MTQTAIRWMSCDNIVNHQAEYRSDKQTGIRPSHLSGVLVVGLGNPFLGDDGVGWRVADAVRVLVPGVEIDYLSLGGLSLMERFVGYERVVIIDAIQTAEGQIGDVTTLALDDLPDHSAGHMTAAHDTSLRTALALGRTMGADLPDEVKIVAVEAARVFDFSEELSPEIEAAIPVAAEAVQSLLQNWAKKR